MTIIPPDDYERDLPATAESLLDVLERMAKKEFLRNNRQLNVSFNWPVGCRVLRVICFMNHLEKLDFSECDLALQHLKHLFRSCPKLIKLHFKPFKKSGINEFIRLKSDFQRLRYLELTCCNHSSWRVVQEILTCLKECVELTVWNHIDNSTKPIRFVKDRYLNMDPESVQNLRILNLWNIPFELAKWILPVCSRIHTLNLELVGHPNDVRNENIRLEQLMEVDVTVLETSDLKGIFRNSRQVKKMKVYADVARLQDLAELGPSEMTEVSLGWREGPSIEEILPTLKRWGYLRRLTLRIWNSSITRSEMLCDFILGLQRLAFLELFFNCVQSETLRDQVNKIVLPRRPNFTLILNAY